MFLYMFLKLGRNVCDATWSFIVHQKPEEDQHTVECRSHTLALHFFYAKHSCQRFKLAGQCVLPW